MFNRRNIMQEIAVLTLLLFVALYAFAVYIEWLRFQHEIKQDANSKVGRDKKGRFTKICK